eukprot:50226-Prorocentrum_minimum.AAC.1
MGLAWYLGCSFCTWCRDSSATPTRGLSTEERGLPLDGDDAVRAPTPSRRPPLKSRKSLQRRPHIKLLR